MSDASSQAYRDQEEKDAIDLTGLELYVVRSPDGLFFRAKGRGGYGEQWVTDIKKAKIYTRIGPARSRVTIFSNIHGSPKIIKLIVKETKEVNEIQRVKKAKESKAKKELLHKKRMLEYQRKSLLEQEKKIKDQLAVLEKNR